MYKRVLLKLSGEALAGEGSTFDPKVLDRLAADIKEILSLGVETAIVVGGGNFIRGKNLTEIGIERVQGDYMGMLATIINALALQSSFERNGIDTDYDYTLKMCYQRMRDSYLRYGVDLRKK